ncbi:MAG: hypothetical protein GEV05_30130 [Betaproteobacteria bacterium]|nr:hypothetical protein [Betaproteobacteria bacterium]
MLNFGGQPYDFTVTGSSRTHADLATAAGLAEIATYADGAGANKLYIIPRNADGTLGTPTSLAADARAVGLEVVMSNFPNENLTQPLVGSS